jgi:hypothetical protein
MISWSRCLCYTVPARSLKLSGRNELGGQGRANFDERLAERAPTMIPMHKKKANQGDEGKTKEREGRATQVPGAEC